VAAKPQRLGRSARRTHGPAYLGQNLHHHPHVHCVATGGGLSCDAPARWMPAHAGWRPARILPAGTRASAASFAASFLARRASGHVARQLVFPWSARYPGGQGCLRTLAGAGCTPRSGWSLRQAALRREPAQVLKYLARYTHRVANQHHRLVEARRWAGGLFATRTTPRPHRHKTMTLSTDEFFLRRLRAAHLAEGSSRSGIMACWPIASAKPG